MLVREACLGASKLPRIHWFIATMRSLRNLRLLCNQWLRRLHQWKSPFGEIFYLYHLPEFPQESDWRIIMKLCWPRVHTTVTDGGDCEGVDYWWDAETNIHNTTCASHASTVSTSSILITTLPLSSPKTQFPLTLSAVASSHDFERHRTDEIVLVVPLTARNPFLRWREAIVRL